MIRHGEWALLNLYIVDKDIILNFIKTLIPEPSNPNIVPADIFPDGRGTNPCD
jgi:hypothetical protein